MVLLLLLMEAISLIRIGEFKKKGAHNMVKKKDLSLEVADPREVGFDPERLKQLKRIIEEDTFKEIYDGAVFVVARHGKIVMHEAVGKTDREKNRSAKLDDVFFIMSITKQITAVSVLMAIEQGKLTLNTRVSDIIPEFGKKGKQNVTVRHILTHTSGLNSEIPYGLPPEKLDNIEAVTEAISNERLLFTPGELVSYVCISAHSVLAVMVQRLDEKKRPYRQILAEDIFAPLGMSDTALGVPERIKGRLVPVVVRDKTPGLFEPFLLESMNYLATETSELPAGGATSTALDIFRFSEMLRRGGELNGNRILSPETVKLATTNQTGNMPNHLSDYMRQMHGWPVFPAYMGLTFFVRGEGIFPAPLGLSVSPKTFAGMGAGSTIFWVDPDRDLSFVFLSAGLMEEAESWLRKQRLSDLVSASLID